MKVKLSKHQKQHLEAGTPGHDVAEKEAKEIIENPQATRPQDDARIQIWGDRAGKTFKVVVSAATSAGNDI